MRISAYFFLVRVFVALSLNAGRKLPIECGLVNYLSTTLILGTYVLLRTTTGLLIVKFQDIVNVIADSLFIVCTAF